MEVRRFQMYMTARTAKALQEHRYTPPKTAPRPDRPDRPIGKSIMRRLATLLVRTPRTRVPRHASLSRSES